MSGKMQLIGALGSLSDTLAKRFDPSFSVELQSKWLGVQLQVGAIARRTGDLMALARDDDRYPPIVADLHAATVSIVNAGTVAKREDALDQAADACSQVENLLGSHEEQPA